MIVWHYTTGTKFELITADGQLKPATTHVPVGEKPILWFSAHPYFEPTARKAWSEGGVIRILEVPELFAKANGLVRLGFPSEGLLDWETLKKESGMNRAARKALEAQGRRQRASPANWWGSFCSLPLSDCLVELMDANHKWIPGNP